MRIDRQKLTETHRGARRRLLAERNRRGHWRGELSSSALATAAAVCALGVIGRDVHAKLIDDGLHWLARNVNSDGGWGDTPISNSNLSTTVLVWAGFTAADSEERFGATVKTAESWIARQCDSHEPTRIAQAIRNRYGTDRTFSAPILAMCAIAGRFGPERCGWELVPQLPFELAAVPHHFWRWLRLSVVSYAMPALIAIGGARHRYCPTSNPVIRLLRSALQTRTLKILRNIQPESGGYLEAVPLTSFVAMSLAGAGPASDPVVRKAADFLVSSARSDGSFPIDTDLSMWVTTLSIAALSEGAEITGDLDTGERSALREWVMAGQHRREHPYTHARGGGWGWTDLPGSVPDADDTAAALLALHKLARDDAAAGRTAEAGIAWLLGLQNGDGGVPTFARGWGRLPFDRSSPDITAHCLRTWKRWLPKLRPPLTGKVRKSVRNALRYLRRTQRQNGSWVPLWFGNEKARGQENPTFGTSRVLSGLAEFYDEERARLSETGARGIAWLLDVQGSDGGWGGDGSSPPSIEETAVAVDALAKWHLPLRSDGERGIGERLTDALSRGCEWLSERTEGGRTFEPAPIGLYFAKLWYYERLYPVIFTLGALTRVLRAGL